MSDSIVHSNGIASNGIIQNGSREKLATASSDEKLPISIKEEEMNKHLKKNIQLGSICSASKVFCLAIVLRCKEQPESSGVVIGKEASRYEPCSSPLWNELSQIDWIFTPGWIKNNMPLLSNQTLFDNACVGTLHVYLNVVRGVHQTVRTCFNLGAVPCKAQIYRDESDNDAQLNTVLWQQLNNIFIKVNSEHAHGPVQFAILTPVKPGCFALCVTPIKGARGSFDVFFKDLSCNVDQWDKEAGIFELAGGTLREARHNAYLAIDRDTSDTDNYGMLIAQGEATVGQDFSIENFSQQNNGKKLNILH